MKKSQFTITLGKFGQRLVKESDRDYDEYRGFNEPVPSLRKRQLEERNGLRDSDGRGFNVPVPSLSKRSLAERIGDKSIEFNSKRMRHDDSAMGYGSNKQTDDDSRIGPNDLRVKLMQKEISRRAQLEIVERKKRELYEKVSRAIQSAEQEGVRQRKTTLSRIVDEPRQMDTNRSTYASPMLNGERTRSPDRVVRYSDGISKRIDERPPQVAPPRQLDAPRPGRFFITDPVDSTRMSVPLPITSRAPLDSGRMVSHIDSGRVVTQLPLGTGGMSRPSHPENQPQPYTLSGVSGPLYIDNQPQPVTLSGMSRPPYQENQSQPVTVSSLLHTIGLGKYAITFQAEEIDMLALRQMGDSDLKEMGIPMGPRKKILHAVEAHTKRLIAQARGNYRQSIEFAR